MNRACPVFRYSVAAPTISAPRRHDRHTLVCLADGRVGWREEVARMIELTDDQLPALDGKQQPPVAVDPRTGQEYLLIRREVYEHVCGFLKPLGRGWDNPADDDLIREDL